MLFGSVGNCRQAYNIYANHNDKGRVADLFRSGGGPGKKVSISLVFSFLIIFFTLLTGQLERHFYLVRRGLWFPDTI